MQKKEIYTTSNGFEKSNFLEGERKTHAKMFKFFFQNFIKIRYFVLVNSVI